MKNENKNINIKKLLFLISTIPYVILLVLGIVNTMKISIENGFLDLYEIIRPFEDIWVSITLDLNIFYIILFLFFIGYPIYYLVNKSSKIKDVTIKQKKIDILYIIYILSFSTYFFLIYSCIFGIEFGLFFNTSTYYGFEAIILALSIFSYIIPIYPLVLIFQIIYSIKKHKTFTQKRKRNIKIMIISIIILLILPAIIILIF